MRRIGLDLEKEVAPESLKTLKARKKIEQRHGTIDKKVTQQALRRKVHEMRVWIAKYAMDRITVKDHDIAPVTKTTEKIIKKIGTIIQENGVFKE